MRNSREIVRENQERVWILFFVSLSLNLLLISYSFLSPVDSLFEWLQALTVIKVSLSHIWFHPNKKDESFSRAFSTVKVSTCTVEKDQENSFYSYSYYIRMETATHSLTCTVCPYYLCCKSHHHRVIPVGFHFTSCVGRVTILGFHRDLGCKTNRCLNQERNVFTGNREKKDVNSKTGTST